MVVPFEAWLNVKHLYIDKEIMVVIVGIVAEMLTMLPFWRTR